MQFTYLVVGGGIAGVSCIEGLHFLHPEESIGLVTASGVVKAVTKSVPVTKLLSDITVEETDATLLKDKCTVIVDQMIAIHFMHKTVVTEKNGLIGYTYLCICTGACPKQIWYSPHVVTIRDTDSVSEFQSKLKSAKKVVIVGNGGIATELVYELKNIEIVWAIKHKHINATFLDPGAAEFFQDSLKKVNETNAPETIFKRMRYEAQGTSGPSMGPDWHTNVQLQGTSDATKIHVEYGCEVERVIDSDDGKWNVYVKLTNGSTHACDMVVSTIGVMPNSDIQVRGHPLRLELSSDGGIKVNDLSMTNIPGIFAAGDVCTAAWTLAPHWFQMRLWTQAKQMGTYAAKCMVASQKQEEVMMDFTFEMFTHMTKFFGFKVILLGLFNGQKLDKDYEVLLRVTRGVEYIKLILKNGRMQGAVLIGETDIEEMCENLILNQLDLTDIADDLLNPDIDIEDYFD